MTPDEDEVVQLETENTAEVVETEEETTTGEGTEQTDKPKTAETEETGEETDTDEEELENAEETAPEGTEKPKRSRAQERIIRQSEELKLKNADNERLIREHATAMAQLENFRQQAQQTASAEQRRVEQERLNLLAPEERALYEANQRMRHLEHRLNMSEAQRAEDADRAAFHAKAQHDPIYAKHLDTIESMYQEGKNRGVIAPRQDLFYYQLGKELAKDMSAKINSTKEKAAKRVDSVTSKPAKAKGDVAGSKSGKTVEDRLRGQPI